MNKHSFMKQILPVFDHIEDKIRQQQRKKHEIFIKNQDRNQSSSIPSIFFLQLFERLSRLLELSNESPFEFLSFFLRKQKVKIIIKMTKTYVMKSVVSVSKILLVSIESLCFYDDFLQLIFYRANCHIKAMGCASSSGIQVANTEEYIDQAKPFQKDSYSFRNVEELMREIQGDFHKKRKGFKNQIDEKCWVVLDIVEIQRQILEHLKTTDQSTNMKDALNSLQDSFNQTKSSKRPPTILLYALDAISILFHLKLSPTQLTQIKLGKQFIFWLSSFEESGKVILGPHFNLLQNLRSFYYKQVNEETMQLLEPLLTAEWFNEQHGIKGSKAIGNIIKWIRNLWSLLHKNDRIDILSIQQKQNYMDSWVESWVRKNAKQVYMEFLQQKYGKIYVQTIQKTKRQCSICLNELSLSHSKFIITQCWHPFHRQCIENWLRNKTTCPYDRINICRDSFLPFPDIA